MDPPLVLVQLRVLGDHVGQGEGGVTARDCRGDRLWSVGLFNAVVGKGANLGGGVFSEGDNNVTNVY